MYKTIRMLPAALLLLLGTACTHDLADNPAATGLPLVLENVYIGAQTRVDATPYDNPEGCTLTATLTWGNVTSTGTYTYRSGQWTSNEPAYWQDPEDMHTLALHTPEPENDMPAEGFTTVNWPLYDILDYPATSVKPGTTTFELTHTRAQLCVMLQKGDGLTSEELAAAKVSVNDTGMLRHLNSAHYALIKPDSEIASVEIDINGSTYPYTPDTDIPLEGGKCTILTLTLNKVDVGGFQVSSGEGWQDVTGIAANGDFTVKECQSGDLTINEGETKLLITGTLTSKDIETINAAKNQITHLYIMAKADEESIWEALNMQASTSLQSVCITEATAIGSSAFSECGQLTSVSLPKVKSTGNYAFQDCKALANVSLPMATTLGTSAFKACTSLASVHLPQVTEMTGSGAFAECTSLTSISLPALKTVGRSAFLRSSITSISLPKVTTVKDHAFSSCSSLTSISLPEATTIEYNAFNSCSALTSICLPKATNIGNGIFSSCSSLASISLPKDANMRITDLEQISYNATLFLCNGRDNTPATEEEAKSWADAAKKLTTVFYNYTGGEDGDYLDPNNYDQVWTRPSN